jgi:hypothetical protein
MIKRASTYKDNIPRKGRAASKYYELPEPPRPSAAGFEIAPTTSLYYHILNTPKLVAGGMPALSDAAILSASIPRVSIGSITPSSHNRALEK